MFLAILYLGLHTMPRAWGTLNTDFPNYYTVARLAHEGYDTTRVYEWAWLQREKDHRAIAVQAVGLIPMTPFSTLLMWPLTGLSALAAKHVWIVVNLALLVPLCWMIRSMTGLSYQRIALVFALSFPLHRNFLFGQFYLFLLVLLAAACWAYLREFHLLAGMLVAVAAACKIFPILLFILFLRRRSWRALISGTVTGIAAAVASVAIFGWNLHRTYLHEILPWTLHGEGMPPYVTSNASISSALHYLLLPEPQWNPHPWHNSPLCFALLQSVLPMLVLAPAILLIRWEDRSRLRILLEWSALLTASLAISTLPASYHFVLIAFSVCVAAAKLLERKQYGWLTILVIVYLGIGCPMPNPHAMMGPAMLLYVPRLPLTLVFLLGIYALMWRDHVVRKLSWEWTHYVWVALMVGFTLVSVRSTFNLQRAVRQEYAYRLPLQTQALLFANPAPGGAGIRSVAFTKDGYHLLTTVHGASWFDPALDDDLSFAGEADRLLVERALSPQSKVVDVLSRSRVVLGDARDPMLSSDGDSLAYVRDDHGQGRLMVRRAFQSDSAVEATLTPASLNVYEASFLSETEYAFSAVESNRPPGIYLTDRTHSNVPLGLTESRYPALSPDKRWMAYSHRERGMWNLWVRDQISGATRRIADVPCNQIQPSWERDSKTLLYGTDCGRSLWFTAVARRRVIP